MREQGGVLAIRLDQVELGSEFTGPETDMTPGLFLRLSVTDTGPGIAPADLPHVFERFYRGDKSRQRHDGGSGLGLAIARSLVEAQGGHIRAESPPSGGTRFVVGLPLVALPTQGPDSTPA